MGAAEGISCSGVETGRAAFPSDCDVCLVQEEVEKVMKRIDINDNGVVEFDEFCAGMMDWKQVCCCQPDIAQHTVLSPC